MNQHSQWVFENQRELYNIASDIRDHCEPTTDGEVTVHLDADMFRRLRQVIGEPLSLMDTLGVET